METALDVLAAGLLLGGIFALIAVGLSLQYGVAKVLNIAHGEFIMIGGFLTWMLYSQYGVNPLLCMLIVGPASFVVGYLLYRYMFTHIRIKAPSAGAFEGNSILAAFGLLFVIQYIALLKWGSNVYGYSYLASPVHLGTMTFATNRLVTLAFAVGISLVFYIFLARTRLGKAIRAAAQDTTAAGLMGVNINRVLAICFGLGALMAGVAGVLLSMCYPINAGMGLNYSIIAIIVVVLGGLGSIVGSFIGGFILGIVGSIVTYFDPGLSLVGYYAIFIILLLVRPKGIMGK
ncbi:MAG: branched-chain amino acid ABC transporter permease [Dehalococcoidia bacterium]|jgi:branched-chain amino acid transport system permease protein